MPKRKKRKKRESDELEQLRNENRELKSIVRSLTKQLKKVSKGSFRLSALEEMVEEHGFQEEKRQERKHRCAECSGELEQIKVVGREFHRCKNCGWRSKANKTKETD